MRSTRRRCRWAGVLWLLAAGCGDARLVELDPPETVSFFGAITLDGEGLVELAATPLLPRGEALEIAAEGEGSTWVLGFDETSLAPLRGRAEARGVEFEDLARSSVVSISGGCADELPPAVWALEILEGETPTERSPQSAPRLQSSWVGTLCEPLPPDTSPDSPLARSWSVESESGYCPRSAFSMVGCAVRFDARACGSARTTTLEFRAHPDGRACFSNEPTCSDQSGPSQGAAPARFDFACREPESVVRRYRVHENEWTSDDVFAEVDWVRVLDQDITAVNADELSRTVQFTNFVSSITSLGSEVLFTTHPSGEAGYNCDLPGPTELVFVDGQTMSPLRTVTATTCLTKIVPDGVGGFLGVSRAEPGRFRAGLYDAGGQLIFENAILDIPAERSMWDHWPSAFLSVPSGFVVVAATGYFTAGKQERPAASETQMVWLDEELRVERVTPSPIEDESLFLALVQRVETLNGPRLLYVDDYSDLIALGDLEGAGLETSVGLGRGFGSAFRVAHVAQLSPASFALSVVGSTPVLAEARLTGDGALEVTRRAYFHDFPADLSSIVKLPSGQVLASAVIRDRNSSEVVWTRFDPESWRFIPGSLRLVAPDGSYPGVAANSLVDSSGRVWLTFSRSPWVARLTPTD